MAERGDGAYLYAVTRELEPARLRDLRGVDGERPRVVDGSGLRAVVGSVELARFRGPPDRHLGDVEDLRSLEALLRAHHRVVQAVAAAAAVVPLRFGTVYRDDGRVREVLDQRQGDFEAALSRVAGRTEWGVKLMASREAFAGDVSAEPPAAPSAPAAAVRDPGRPGTEYLRRQREAERTRQAGWDRAAAFAAEVHAELAGVAVESRRHTPQDTRLSGQGGWMLLNGAYLVDDGHQDELVAVVERFDDPDRGVRLELTGPWAPYSFTEPAGADGGEEVEQP
jgi:gas vesicle protein GvpL/GvpF